MSAEMIAKCREWLLDKGLRARCDIDDCSTCRAPCEMSAGDLAAFVTAEREEAVQADRAVRADPDRVRKIHAEIEAQVTAAEQRATAAERERTGQLERMESQRDQLSALATHNAMTASALAAERDALRAALVDVHEQVAQMIQSGDELQQMAVAIIATRDVTTLSNYAGNIASLGRAILPRLLAAPADTQTTGEG